jgi:hypothetical protein
LHLREFLFIQFFKSPSAGQLNHSAARDLIGLLLSIGGSILFYRAIKFKREDYKLKNREENLLSQYKLLP